MSKSKYSHPRVWTWRIQEGLCYCTEYSREGLGDKPSPEAKPVRVRLVPESEYLRLVRGEGE